MANKKPAPKKIVKPAAKPVKKTVPAKKAVAKPAPKPIKKAAYKPAPKPVKKAAYKPAPKPVKKAAAKPAPKPVKKAAAKPAEKPAKKATAKPFKKIVPVKKPVAKPAANPVAKPAPKKPVIAPQPIAKKPVPQVKHEVKHVPEKKPNAVALKSAAKKIEKQEPLKEVKVPKITAKQSVPYKPDYKPMGQRTEQQKDNAPLIRYNDVELTEFRELIQKKLEAAKRELGYLQGLITRKDDMGGDESENRYMTMEDGSISMEREQLSQMASRQITYIDHLEKALIRIENKTYGICRVSGRLIDKARLRAVPHATLSLEAKLGLVKPNQE